MERVNVDFEESKKGFWIFVGKNTKDRKQYIASHILSLLTDTHAPARVLVFTAPNVLIFIFYVIATLKKELIKLGHIR